jgi:hypothetical protein
MKIKLESIYGANTNQTTEMDAESWPDIAEKFYFFLLSSGYVLSFRELADAYDDMATGYQDALNNDGLSVPPTLPLDDLLEEWQT